MLWPQIWSIMWNVMLTAVWSVLVHWLGAGAVEFVMRHAEVSIAFAEEKKIPEVQLLCVHICVSN